LVILFLVEHRIQSQTKKKSASELEELRYATVKTKCPLFWLTLNHRFKGNSKKKVKKNVVFVQFFFMKKNVAMHQIRGGRTYGTSFTMSNATFF